ncbi:MAG: DUF1289 domain-containing protein [Aquabacterium sp.]
MIKPPPPLGEPAQSPCINICRMHPVTGWCEGCSRTLDEITAWGRLGDAQRRAIWTELPQRQALWRQQMRIAAPAPAPTATDVPNPPPSTP